MMRFLLALAAAAVPLFAQCTYTVSVVGAPPSSPLVFNAGPGSDTGTVNGQAAVSAPPGCGWVAKANSDGASWISVNLPPPNQAGQSAGVGDGTVGFSVARNPSQSPRTGTISVANSTITVIQAGAVCSFTIAPTSINFPVGGGSGTVQVTASCTWSTGVSQTWITIPPNTFGVFDGTFNYTVAANACLGSRTGGILVGLPGTQGVPQLQITQDGSPNNLTLSPTTATVGPDLTDGKLTVTIGAGCPWSAFSDVSWLSITSIVAGTGASTLSYRAAANPSSARTGNIHVGPQLFALTQQAVAAPPIQLTAVTNAASGVQGPVSPGEIVSLFGSNMGPVTGIPLQLSADGKSITKSLGGVQVLFDGTAAALTYASAGQINAVVPYSLVGSFNTQVQVQYQGNSSNLLPLAVLNASPGIFTLDASGRGAGAILNLDYTVNANANPAARGSVVSIYCTGGGATDPASVDGGITGTPLPYLTQPVSVLIGGSIAQVVYSGGAPTAVAGLTQINVVVPQGVTPGPTVPVIVGIGAGQSQPGVTLAVK